MEWRRVRQVLLSIPVALVMTVGAVGFASPAQAATTAGLWHMNEAPGARVMHDSSGHGLNGSIGSDVRTGVVVAGATGYRFPLLSHDAPSPHPQHLVLVPHNSLLNPGTGRYVVTIRYRTTTGGTNVVQKGQAGAAGGYWKIEQQRSGLVCHFQGSNGQRRAVKSTSPLTDGRWHTVRCERTASAVTMVVDGRTQARLAGPTGSISNTNVLSIGGKAHCDQVTVTCDYFAGDLDFVRIEKG